MNILKISVIDIECTRNVLALLLANTCFFVLLAVAVFGVVVSIYYYFAIVRTIFWGRRKADEPTPPPVTIGLPVRIVLGCCVAAMLYLGLLPNKPVKWAETAAKVEVTSK